MGFGFLGSILGPSSFTGGDAQIPDVDRGFRVSGSGVGVLGCKGLPGPLKKYVKNHLFHSDLGLCATMLHTLGSACKLANKD